MLSFLALLVLVVLVSVGAASYAALSGRKLRNKNWTELLLLLKPVPHVGLEVVALDHLQPEKGQLKLQPGEMWDLVGGFEGLNAMYGNAQIMCALAAQAEEWNYEEAIIVTERIRREAASLRRAVLSIALRYFCGRFEQARIPFLVHEAASSYYLMRARLLALYETSHVARYPQLASAL